MRRRYFALPMLKCGGGNWHEFRRTKRLKGTDRDWKLLTLKSGLVSDDNFRLLAAILALKNAHFAFELGRQRGAPDETGFRSAPRANDRRIVGWRRVNLLSHPKPPNQLKQK